MQTDRDRVIQSLTWNNPNSLVVESYFSAATWKKYREQLEPLRMRLENDFAVFPIHRGNYDQMPPTYREGQVFTDAWGCVWECRVDGLEGIITHFPLAGDWSKLDKYHPPDPDNTLDKIPWDQKGFEEGLRTNVAAHKYITGGWERLWERVHFLRGYDNTMMDLAYGDAHIRKLIDMIVEYDLQAMDKFLRYDEMDCIVFGDDWGSQDRLMVRPEMWREYFFEGYRTLFQAVKATGRSVYFHTDGYLMPIVPDLIKAGADIINLQYRPNGLLNIKDACLNKVCVSVDIDRQQVMPFGTPAEMKQHIRDIYQTMNGGKGGLWIKIDVYPDTPLENIEAMCEVVSELRPSNEA